MFDLFSGSHILILLAVLLVVVGPKDLPRFMRMVGQWVGKARAMANEFKKSFDDMARQEELDKLREELDKLRTTSIAAVDEAQRVAEADLPVENAGAALPEESPRSGEYQINATPVDSHPETAPPVPAASAAPHP